MANQIPLMAYLQTGLPAIPLNPPENPSDNTTNSAYNAFDITYIGAWEQFSLPIILQRWQQTLAATTLRPNPFGESPPPTITAENPLRHRITEMLLPRTRRALRAGFTQLHANNQLNGLTPLAFDLGETAQTPSGFTPDLAYPIVGLQAGAGPNRAPGEVKPSWKWNTGMANGTVNQQTEFRQALSQVNWYMKQHRARYGFILTDREMVAIRRLDNNGRLELSAPIPWGTAGGVQPQLTVMLALWYIGMLAAQDQGPDQWRM